MDGWEGLGEGSWEWDWDWDSRNVVLALERSFFILGYFCLDREGKEGYERAKKGEYGNVLTC